MEGGRGGVSAAASTRAYLRACWIPVTKPPNIHHVFQVADQIVVLRRGTVAADIDPRQTTIEDVERVITGMQRLPVAQLTSRPDRKARPVSRIASSDSA